MLLALKLSSSSSSSLVEEDRPARTGFRLRMDVSMFSFILNGESSSSLYVALALTAVAATLAESIDGGTVIWLTVVVDGDDDVDCASSARLMTGGIVNELLLFNEFEKVDMIPLFC